MKKIVKVLSILAVALIACVSNAQNAVLQGYVYEIHVGKQHSDDDHNTTPETKETHKDPLIGVGLRWLGTSIGTATDVNGHFKLNKPGAGSQKLVVSYVGYKNDTLTIPESKTQIDIYMSPGNINLSEIVVTADLEGSFISKMRPINTEIITGHGLTKAACCNLAESFQNSATVTVSYADAVTGAKQIEMLGLSGVYSQLLLENIPNMRGLATSFGLGYIPGPWMEAIQVSKGTSSVVNGYESTTGQINVEYKKPENSEKLYLNFFGSDAGRYEANANASYKINSKLGTTILLHGENTNNKFDHNHDGFIDMPLVKQYNIMNRWNYENPGKFEAKYGVKAMQEERSGGQMSFDKSLPRDTKNGYGVGINTNRYEVFAKNGILFPKYSYRSIGTILSATRHTMDAFFGLNKYKGEQNSLYGNFIYQSIIKNTNHKFNTGLSFMLDDYRQGFNDSTFNHQDIVPGAFFEYTYSYADALTIMAGLRADEHNRFGTFVTPRFHFRYQMDETTTLRASAGKGYRVPNAYAENTSLMTSSRKWVFVEAIKPEQAWNYGVSLVKEFKIAKKKFTYSLDLYRTDFVNQMVIDLDKDAGKALFYNLKGTSYSNCIQTELTFTPVKRFDVTMAYKYNDVKMTIDEKLQEKPFVNKYIGLVTLSYRTKYDKWQFDFTTHLNGSVRIPSTAQNAPMHQMAERSPEYFIFYSQITRRFKHWECYVGGENLSNYTQKHPIIASEDPFGKHFDTSMIWGPVMGRKIYAGLRYFIK